MGGDDVELAPPLLNWDFIGRCYDVLKADPLDLKQGATVQMAYAYDTFEDVADHSASKPVGLDYLAAPGGTFDQRVSEMSSSYDFKTTFRGDGSLTVSDPTGDLFSASLSTSFTRTRQDINTRSSVVTYTSEGVSTYKLQVRTDPKVRTLDQALASALGALPTVAGAAHEAFIAKFGTHVAHAVTFGGRATQRIVVSRQDYDGFLEEGIDIHANVSATFDIAKVGASGGVVDTRSQQFKTASGVTVESIVYTGGTAPQQMWDMWAQYVKNAPAPIEIAFEPLHSLLVPEFFPHDQHVEQRRAALEAATNSYLSTQGRDTRLDLLRPGDRVTLALVAEGLTRCLAATSGYVRTTVLPGGGDAPPSLLWALEAATPNSGAGALTTTTPITFRNPALGSYLDAQAGSDNTYSPGDGLLGLRAGSPAADSGRWTFEFASDRGRTEVVDGDAVLIRSAWSGSDGQRGLMLGEPKALDAAQRVFSFGARGQNGTIWRIARVVKGATA